MLVDQVHAAFLMRQALPLAPLDETGILRGLLSALVGYKMRGLYIQYARRGLSSQRPKDHAILQYGH